MFYSFSIQVLYYFHFILFDAIINAIDFLISLLNCLFLVHRNTTDVLKILYPATFLNSFIRYNSIFWCGLPRKVIFYIQDHIIFK